MKMIPKNCRSCDRNIRNHSLLEENLDPNQQLIVGKMLCGDCPVEDGPWGEKDITPVTVYDLPDMPPFTCPLTGWTMDRKHIHEELLDVLYDGDRADDRATCHDNASVRFALVCPLVDECPKIQCVGRINMNYHLTSVHPQGQDLDIDLLEDLGKINHVRLSGAALKSHLKGINPSKLYFQA